MAFILKKVNGTAALGPDLIELRERAGLSIEEAAKLSKLTPGFIRALEGERWSELPDPAYVERLLKMYVTRFGVNDSYYLHKYREGLRLRKIEKDESQFLPRPVKVAASAFLVTPRLFAAAGFLLFILLLGGYVVYQARTITSAPFLQVTSPDDGLKVSQPEVFIKGKTDAGALVMINGAATAVSPSGDFEQTIRIPQGTTMFVITAKRRRGAETVEVRRVVYERSTPTSTQPTP